MITETDARRQLRDWIAAHSKNPDAAALSDDTNLIDNRIITSVQILDLILFIEQVSGKSVSVDLLKAGSFKSIDTIYNTFLGGE